MFFEEFAMVEMGLEENTSGMGQIGEIYICILGNQLENDIVHTSAKLF